MIATCTDARHNIGWSEVATHSVDSNCYVKWKDHWNGAPVKNWCTVPLQ